MWKACNAQVREPSSMIHWFGKLLEHRIPAAVVMYRNGYGTCERHLLAARNLPRRNNEQAEDNGGHDDFER